MWTIWWPISSRLRKNERQCRDDRRLLWTAGCAGLHQAVDGGACPVLAPCPRQGGFVAGRELARRVGSRCPDPPSRRPLCSPGWIDEIAPLVLEVRLVQMGLLRLLVLLTLFLDLHSDRAGVAGGSRGWRQAGARGLRDVPHRFRRFSSSIRTSAPRPSSRWLLTLRSRRAAFARSFRRPMQRCRT